MKIAITKPDGSSKEREFVDRREAAQYGVAYYLLDNGYATRREASATATTFERSGTATFENADGAFVFTAITSEES